MACGWAALSDAVQTLIVIAAAILFFSLVEAIEAWTQAQRRRYRDGKTT